LIHGINGHGHGLFTRARHRNYIRKRFDGFQVIQGHFVVERLRLVRPLHQFHPNQVGADSFDLREHEFSAGQRHGDHQYDGSAAYDHA
jgi:hypothetical protein